jgi:hypothetical protein
LLRVLNPSLAEKDCLAIHVFESLHEPVVFAIHKLRLSSTRNCRTPFDFFARLKKLLTHPADGLRSREIAGGAGAGGTD